MSTIDPSTTETITPEVVDEITPYDLAETPASPLDHPYRFTRKLYSALIDAGIFRKQDSLYLWKGRLVAKMAKSRPHTIAQTNLTNRLARLIPEGWHFEQDQPIAIGTDGMPEPDLIIVRGAPNDYPSDPPTARDVPLIVEVSDNSLAEDLGDVLRTYAEQEFAVYWVVDLTTRRVLVHSDPTGPSKWPDYRLCQKYEEGHEVPIVLDGREIGRIAVSTILS